MSKTKEWYEEYAKENGLKLTKFADKMIKALDKTLGYCPCKVGTQGEIDDIICPCVDHLKEIEETGHCHCNLFEEGFSND